MIGQAVLVVVGGLPGTGKTTISQLLVRQHAATYLRIDAIEQAIRAMGRASAEIGAAGYAVAQALAISNLRCGRIVVADCVNPVPESRNGWRAAADAGGSPLVQVELFCSDATEHRRRIETRASDIPGLSLPTWADVLAHDYVAGCQSLLRIDTASVSAFEAAGLISTHLAVAHS